jgi:putative FmdB family regulatory protein
VPTYSYACTECDNKFDVVQAFSDDALTQCPECEGRLRKLFGKVGVVFKGSGFYRTDSRTSDSDKPSSNGKSESSTKDQAGSKQSEAGSSADSKAGSGSTSSTASVSASSSAS